MKPTVTVSTIDLHRLLLAFREATEHPSRHPWMHMHDWDIRFERLADAIEEACGKNDDRIRCNRAHSCYDWGEDWEEAVPVNVRAGSLSGTPARLRHVAERSDGTVGFYRALCGMSFVDDDVAKKPKTDYDPCPVCAREARLWGIPGPQVRRATCLAS